MKLLTFILQAPAPLRALQQLYNYVRHSRATGTPHPQVESEEEDDEDLSICSGGTDSTLSICSPPSYIVNDTPIPFTLHSDVPIPAVCSNGFSNLRSTSLVEFSTALPPCLSGGVSDSGMLLTPCIWLILGSYAFILICIMIHQVKTFSEPKLDIVKPVTKVHSKQPGELVYISRAPFPTPEEVTQRTLENYSCCVADSDAADNHPCCEPRPSLRGPAALAPSPSWHNALRNNPDVLFRGPITPDTLKNANLESTKPPTLHRGPSAPAMMKQSDVPPMPPSIPIINTTNLVNRFDKPDSTACRPVGDSINDTNNARASSRYRSPPINTSTVRPSMLSRDPSYRCFNPSPLKNVSISVPSPTMSPPCTPELRTPVPTSTALFGNELNKSMWARGV